MLDRRTNARLRPLTLCAVSALITHESISRSMSRLMRRRTSSSLEPPEDAILVNGVSELGEVHVRDRQVVLDPLHGGRNRAEFASGLAPQIDDQNGMFKLTNSYIVNDQEEKRALITFRDQIKELLPT